MSDTLFTSARLSIGDRVQTPIGKGHILAYVDGDRYLISYSRKEYKDDPEGWLKISRHNGPCVFRPYAADQLKLVTGT